MAGQPATMAKGGMSVLFTGVTLGCAQIGSALVAVPAFFQQTLVLPGVAAMVILGLATMLACFYLQELWLHSEKQLSTRLLDGQACAQSAASSPRHRNMTKPIIQLQYVRLLGFVLLDCNQTTWAPLAEQVTLAAQVTALGGTAVSEVIQTGSSMYIATGYGSPQFWAIICGTCIMIPLTWVPDYKTLERFSMVAVLSVIFTGAIVVAIGSGPIGASYQRCGADEFSISTFFLGISGFLFIWGGGAIVPEVQSAMREPAWLTRSMVLNVLYCCAVCIPTGYFGLNLCRSHSTRIAGNVLAEMPRSFPQRAAAASLSVHMIVAFAVLLMPLMEAFEKKHPRLQRSWERLCSRTIWALLVVLIGVAMPFFGDLIGLVGAISQVYLSFVAPPVMFIAVFRNRLGSTWWGLLQLGSAWAMAVIMAIIGWGLGTYASAYGLYANIHRWGFFQRFY